MKRNTFLFDGGTVRFTLVGAVLAAMTRLIGWLLVAAVVFVSVVFVCLAVMASYIGFDWGL